MGRPDSGRSRRRRDQGRAQGRGRRHPRLGAAVRRGRRRQASRRCLFPRHQPRQALDRARFRDRGRPAPGAQARRALRRADREFQGRRPRQVRPRLREPRAGEPAADLLLGHRLRPERPLCAARRLRPDGAGHRRLHEPHRHGGRRADARRRAGLRHLHRRLFGGRHPGGAGAARDGPAAAAMSIPRWSTPRSACSPTRRSTTSSPARCRSASATRIPTSCPTRCSRSPTATSSSPPATTASTSSCAACSARRSWRRSRPTRTTPAGSPTAPR